MAERRMFAKTIVTSDAFLDLPPTARCLYFFLAMMADDDGFMNAPNSAIRQSGATIDDMKLLIAKRFILTFESGVVVIKHWKIHNLIQKDRYKPTVYLKEKNQLDLDENKAYTEALSKVDTPCIQNVSKVDTPCIQNVSKVDTQVRVGEESQDKDSLDKGSVELKQGADSDIIVLGTYNNVYLTNADYSALKNEYPYTYNDLIENFSAKLHKHGYKYKNHYAAILQWAKEDGARQPGQTQKQQDGSFDIDEFYDAALKRSEREYKKLSKTAAEDPALLDRLKNGISS